MYNEDIFKRTYCKKYICRFACPLFRDFRENKNAELKDADNVKFNLTSTDRHPFNDQDNIFRILLELRMKEVAVTTGAIRCAKLQSTRHHQQTPNFL